MKIRSVTSFVPVSKESFIKEDILTKLKAFNEDILTAFDHSDFEVQSIRCATNPFPEYLSNLELDKAIKATQQIETGFLDVGFDYVSIGTVGVDQTEYFKWIPELIKETNNVFATAQMVSFDQRRISLKAIKAISSIMKGLSKVEANGFGNLYFAGLANVPGGIPFLPAAYKSAEDKSFSYALAMESADLAVSAFSSAHTLDEAADTYCRLVEENAALVEAIVVPIGQRHGLEFLGFDFTPAPFVIHECSAGYGFEKLTGQSVGELSSVSAAAFLMSVLDEAKFKRSGFNGLMLPVLEDNVLALRVAEGKLSLKDLLLFSTVCGTGLDTVPLPGDITEQQLQAILMDVASLSVRLNKPLTARLMPIPGKKAGQMTSFDFPFFTNSRVMSPKCSGLSGLFSSSDSFKLVSRI